MVSSVARIQLGLSVVGLRPGVSMVGLRPGMSLVNLRPGLSLAGLRPGLRLLGLLAATEGWHMQATRSHAGTMQAAPTSSSHQSLNK